MIYVKICDDLDVFKSNVMDIANSLRTTLYHFSSNIHLSHLAFQIKYPYI